MWKYTLERIILIFFTAFIILSVTYLLMKLLPVSSPAGQVSDQLRFYQQQVNLGYMEVIPYNLKDTAQITLLDPQTGKEYYFSYKPVLEQYGSWIYNIFTQWNWGVSSSIAPGQDIMSIIAVRLPYSIKINIYATLIDVPVGFGLGIWAAVKKNKLTDSIISTLVMIFISVPSFVLVSFLISLFGYQLKWLPTTWPSDSTSDVGTKVLGYVIPVATLALGSVASFTRYTRAELTEVMSNDFMVLARTKGLTKGQAIVHHALRNSGVVLFPMVIGEFISILSGSMILEQIYSIPGIVTLFVQAIQAKDYNVIMVDMAI